QQPTIISEPTTPSPPKMTTTTPSRPMYFVNVHSLALRDGPTMSAPQIATLNFHDELELLETSGGWGRVRDVRRNIIGWSYMRCLQPVAADDSQAVPRPGSDIRIISGIFSGPAIIVGAGKLSGHRRGRSRALRQGCIFDFNEPEM
ncbi:MAG: SH3 domain-containing protein, partial [Desulfobaccales bacterium]